MPTSIPDNLKGAADHTGPRVVGANPYVNRDPLVECPVCGGDPLMTCPPCDSTGRVTPRKADILRRQRESKRTEKVG